MILSKTHSNQITPKTFVYMLKATNKGKLYISLLKNLLHDEHTVSGREAFAASTLYLMQILSGNFIITFVLYNCHSAEHI
jgi:hypothetical protein